MAIRLTLPRGRRVLIHIAIAYLGTLAVLFVVQRSLIYQPFGSYHPPEERGLQQTQELSLPTADGLNALAWFSPPQADKGKILVYFHGNGGSMGQTAWLLRMMQQTGFGFLALEYRGYPGYEGTTTEEGIYYDARAAMNFLHEKGYKPEDIILFGHSLGSGVAVQMAMEYDVGLVALVSPYTSVADVAALVYWFIPARYLVLDRFDSHSKVTHVAEPIYIFHGTDDHLIPHMIGKQLFEAVTSEKRFFDLVGQDHNRLDFAYILRQIAAFK